MDLTDPKVVMGVARRVGLRRKRDFGQHFLVSSEVRDSIIEALGAGQDDVVWEIGPGVGTLTQVLAPICRSVIAVEIDAECVSALKITLHGLGNVRVIQNDVLRETAESLALPDDYLAVGNLPYNLTGKILSHLFEPGNPPRRGVFLVQREVADRIAGPPGNWSLATVALRSIAAIELVADVSPGSFLPAPAVNSSIIRMFPQRTMSQEDREQVISMARFAFQLRRKTLRHGVARACQGDRELAAAVLQNAGIDSRRRPETLDLTEWLALARSARALR